MEAKDMTGSMMLLPPAKHLCQTCAHDHAPEAPHNAHSMYFQVAFKMQHGRDPTWSDAWAHCAPDVQAKWKSALENLGVDIDGGKLYPAKKGQ